MNAVNLIPVDSRRRRLALSTSWPTLALVVALLVVLAGAVLYVTAANNVKSRQAQLAQVTASVNSWRRVAGSYQSFTQMAQQRNQELADIRQLAVGRYPWEHLLSQIGGLMPTNAALSTLQAATSGSTTGTGTPPSTSGTSAPATTGGSAALLPAVQLVGCAVSQSTVAQTMVQLHRIQGVAAVTLASATDTSASGSGSGGGSASSAGSGGCPFPVQYQMSLAFSDPAPAAATAAGTAPTTSGATTTPNATTTPSSPATPSTPAASASTNTSGVTAQ
jgi:hypothetical protein